MQKTQQKNPVKSIGHKQVNDAGNVTQDKPDFELNDLKNKYLRVLADYQNLEKRVERDMQANRDRILESIISQLFPLADTIERASKFRQDDGFVFAQEEWNRILNQYGILKIDKIGSDFDPYLMECIELVNGEEAKVVEVVETGYRRGDRIIRPAKVKVGSSNISQ